MSVNAASQNGHSDRTTEELTGKKSSINTARSASTVRPPRKSAPETRASDPAAVTDAAVRADRQTIDTEPDYGVSATFVIDQSSGFLAPPQLAPQTSRVLFSQLSPLPLPAMEIRKACIRDTASAEGLVRQLAESQFDGDAARSEKKSVAEAVVAGLEERVRGGRTLQERLLEQRDHTELLKSTPGRWAASKPGGLWGPGMFWLLTQFAICVAFMICIGAFELDLCYSLVALSGMELPGVLGALSLAGGIAVLLPIAIKLGMSLSPARRSRAEHTLRRAAIPLAFASLATYAWKLGVMQDATSLTTTDQPFAPTGWMLILAELVGNALVGTALLAWLLHVVSLLLLSEVTYAPVFEHSAQQVNQSNTTFAEVVSLKHRVEGVLRQLSSAKEFHVQQALTLCREACTEMEARMAVKRYEAAQELLRGRKPTNQ